MNLQQAIQNVDTVLQNARMTRGEHIELDSNLKLLVARAQLADKLEQEIVVLKGQLKMPPEKDEEETEDGSRTQ